MSFLLSEFAKLIIRYQMLCKKILFNLDRGYFKNYNDTSYYCHFFKGNFLLWEYVELYILLQISYFKDPLSVINWIKGENLEKLLEIIYRYNSKIKESKIGHLIEVSFNHNKNEPDQKSINDMINKDMVISLEYLFKPPNDRGIYKSVFKDVDF